MRAGLYERVSTEEQAKEGFSIAAQDEKGRAFIMSQGWVLHDTYLDDGVSAKDTDRPELQRLFRDVSDKKIDVIVVYKLDRFTRSVKDLYDMLEFLEKHGVKFRSVTEPYDTTSAAGKLFITLVAALAQWERENLAERVRFGMEQMFREGKRPGAKMPYGYTKEGGLVEEECSVLREIRNMYMLHRHGYKFIANHLNECGKLRRGKQWTSYTVYFVLSNPFYAGKMRWGAKKKDGKYATRKMEKFVEVSLADHEYPTVFTWEEYIEQINFMKSKEFDGYSKKREYWFKGILRCGKCGSSMTGRFHQNKRKDGTYNKITSYICSKRQISGSSACSMPMFRQELVEKLVMEYIEGLKTDYTSIENKINIDNQENNKLKIKLDNLNSDKQAILARRKKWQYAFINDLITEDELSERNKEDRGVLESINKEIDSIMNKLSVKPSKTLDDAVRVHESWNSMNDSEKQEMMNIIFKEIVLYTPLDKAKATKGKYIPALIQDVTFN